MSAHPSVLVGGPRDGQVLALTERQEHYICCTCDNSIDPLSSNFTRHVYRRVTILPNSRGAVFVHESLTDLEAYYHIIQGSVNYNNSNARAV